MVNCEMRYTTVLLYEELKTHRSLHLNQEERMQHRVRIFHVTDHQGREKLQV
jgi:hypothetical protein